MSAAEATTAFGSIRIDRLLVYLRFARTRSAAVAMIEAYALRRNRKHVLRGSEPVRIGDVLTIATRGANGGTVRVIEIIALPDRRASPTAARSHYRQVDGCGVDPQGQFAIAAVPRGAGRQPDDPEDRL